MDPALALQIDQMRQHRSACRAVQPTVGEGGVTRLPGLLGARYLGPAAEPARAWVVARWSVLRPALANREAAVPRIWAT